MHPVDGVLNFQDRDTVHCRYSTAGVNTYEIHHMQLCFKGIKTVQWVPHILYRTCLSVQEQFVKLGKFVNQQPFINILSAKI